MIGPGPADGARLHRLAVPEMAPGPLPRLAAVLGTCAGLLLALSATLVLVAAHRGPTAGWVALLLGVPALTCLWVAGRERQEHPRGVVLVRPTPDGLVVPGTGSRRRAAWLACGLGPALLVGGLAAAAMSEVGVVAVALALGLILVVVARGALYRARPGRWTTPRLLLTPDGLEVVVPFLNDGLPVELSWAQVEPLDPASAHPMRQLVAAAASPADSAETRLVGPALLGDERAVAALVEHYRAHPEARHELADGGAIRALAAGVGATV